ncbi:hypothetical protein [Vannielia litorea]|uniref:hypothetical protein n=1 Tax=Vannielia litorea TaxID=1217970 RepID=UPI001C972CA0|nr:hypothetical protein [Vannielia litorea]MBY6048160.1 hypothetical protein [Vannielia litorea]MBY6075574.1 hypothetical protein [Vannielia litorea]
MPHGIERYADLGVTHAGPNHGGTTFGRSHAGQSADSGSQAGREVVILISGEACRYP